MKLPAIVEVTLVRSARRRRIASAPVMREAVPAVVEGWRGDAELRVSGEDGVRLHRQRRLEARRHGREHVDDGGAQPGAVVDAEAGRTGPDRGVRPS